jgi:uncharacterized protein YqgC (DUF456 family)
MTPWLDTTFRIVILLGLLLSWGGTVIPIFPGPTVMWVFVLVYGIVAGFDTLGAILFGIISLLTVASWLTDNVFSIRGARQGGAEWSSVAIATGVGLVSSLFLTPVGGIALTLLALYLMELHHKRDGAKAWLATKEMLMGWGWATLVRLSLGFGVLILWGIWAWL